jgi:hypothetical protein
MNSKRGHGWRLAQRVLRLVAMVGAVFAPMCRRGIASADHYEATITVRPIGGMGRFTESVTGDGRGTTMAAYGGGAVVSLAYGVRNWLDVGVELAAVAFAQTIYDPAEVTVLGVPETGRVTRTSRLAQLRAGGTLRFGVAWIPTLSLGVGPSVRMPTAGTLRQDIHGDSLDLTADGMSSDAQLDGCVALRVGIEHRLNRRWNIGAAAEASRSVGVGARSFDVVSAGLSLSYTWYPNL